MKNNDNESKNIKIIKYIFLILIFFVLFGSGFYFGKNSIDDKKNITSKEKNKELRQAGYKFISPLLECESEDSAAILKPTEFRIKSLVQEKIINSNSDVQISLYYRDLKNGPTFGINDQEEFSPASLLKVPFMIAYYKYAQIDPGILNKEINFSQATSEFQQNINSNEHIRLGQNYTVSNLIERMIKHSDNEATNLLFQNIDQNVLRSVFSDLGIAMPDIYNPNNSMLVKSYAAFFRILFNASYLDRNMSEHALELLSNTEYKNGLLSGVPDNIVVSHKFGERESKDSQGKLVTQLHDCGIIYHPDRPYLLCIMTRGGKIDKLSKIISEISKVFYNEIDASLK